MKNLLIVEDEKDLAEILVEILKSMVDVEIDCVASIEEAKAKLKNKEYCHILTDFNIVGGTAFDLIRSTNIPYTIMSGCYTTLDKLECNKIAKPFDVSDLEQLANHI